jgi:hypothetical protein
MSPCSRLDRLCFGVNEHSKGGGGVESGAVTLRFCL